MSEDMAFDSFAEIDDFINENVGKLLDQNSEVMMYSREQAIKFSQFRFRIDEILDDIGEALAIGAFMINKVTGDIIADEMGIREATLEELEAEEDDSQ